MPRSSDDNLGMARELQRRSFLKMAAGVGLGVGAVSRESTNSNINKAVPNLEDRILQEALSPLGNGESPCMQLSLIHI